MYTTNDILGSLVLDDYLLEVKNLKKYFPIRKGWFRKNYGYIKAVDDVSFNIKRGETLGLVGESGCGKSTLARTLVKLYEATEGEIIFEGAELNSISQKDFVPIRKNMQMIFQDPYASLNTKMTLSDIIGEPIDIHGIASGQVRDDMVYELLNKVGLSSDFANRYPHEFSGGQRQRIGIARALAVKPKFLICDEPVSALDVSVQAHVINMLLDFQQEYGLTYLFIAHNLAMLRHVADNIGVMYLGKLVEIAPSNEVYNKPAHPYTQALLSSVPIPDPVVSKKKRIIIQGDVPSNINPPSGCKFSTRCKYVKDICRTMEPILKDIGSGHKCACHLY